MRIQAATPSRQQPSREFYKRLLLLTGAGGAAFWITDFVISISPIGAIYKAAFSIVSLSIALAEALAGGLVIALGVSYIQMRFFERIPAKKSIFKALILSFGAMVLIEVLSALGDLAHASLYLLLDTGMNLPRFVALALAVGSLCETTKER